jgi:predicted RNase H-like HicB family nuclease
VIIEYVTAAMRHARYEIVEEDRSYYGEIPGFQGVWADGQSLEGCREQLQEVLEKWILLRVRERLPLPEVDGHTLEIGEVAWALA